MATFTITADSNIDALVGKAGDDTYNVNGAKLTVDQDSHYGLNGGYILGHVTGSASLGGDVVFDSSLVRLIPYNTGSGTVPAYNTAISQGGASGLLIGVYSALNVAPTAPGGAMPASGYIKIKQWNSVAYASGALTGIGATSTGADVVGWLEIVGAETRTLTLNGLNNTTVPAFQGGWYQIGVTPGTPARTDTYQIPTNGNVCFVGGVYVETSAGSDVYELWHKTSDTATVDKVPTDGRGKRICWIDAGGVLRFGHDGTNSTGGVLPAAGCKIRMGNLILNSATAAAPTVNTLSATVANRYKFGGITLGSIVMDKVICNWYMAVTSIKTLTVTNSVVAAPIILSQLGDATTWTDSGVTNFTALATYNLNLSVCPYGGTFTNFSSSGTFPSTGTNTATFRATLSNDIILDGVMLKSTGTRVVGASSLDLTSVNNFECGNGQLGSRIIRSTGSNHWLHDIETWGDNDPTFPIDATNFTVDTVTGITGSLLEDFTFPYAPNLPAALYTATSSTKDYTLRNLGSYSSPINGRGYAEVGASWVRVSTTGTVTTSSPHGLRTGDRVYVYLSDSVSAVTTALKTVTVLTSTTFTFPTTATGATSGVLSFYQTSLSLQLTAQGSSNCENFKIQNVWFKGSPLAVAAHASMKKIYFENCSFDDLTLAFVGSQGTEIYHKGMVTGAGSPSTGSAVLGQSFIDRLCGVLADKITATGVSWTRSNSTITVTSTNHGLLTGDIISVYDSTNEQGARETTSSITVLTKDTFTYTGASSGTTSGTLSYRVVEASLLILMNGASSATASEITFAAGTPNFTGAGTLVMFNVGDTVVWELPYYALNFDGFQNAHPLATLSTGTIANYDFFYALDRNDGSGFGSYKNMYVGRSGASGTSGGFTITGLSTTVGLNVGDNVWNAIGISGVGTNTKIVSIDSASQVTVDVAHSSTFSSASLYFGGHPSEPDFPAEGVKIRFKMVTTVAQTATITNVYIPLRSTAISRARLYPQAVDTVSFALSGLPSGTTVALYDNTDTELQREDGITSGEFVYEYVHSGVDFEDNYYVIWHPDYVPYKSGLFDLTATDLGLSYTPVDDPIYDAAHDDRYTIDFPNKLIVMDTGETQYDVPGAYSQWKDDIFLADNFTYDFAFTIKGGVAYAAPKEIPAFTALINGWKIRPDEDDHTLTVENGILYVEGGGDPFVDTLGAYTVRINYSQPAEVLLVSTGSGVLPSDITDIAEAVWQNTDTNTGTQKGKILKDARDDAELGVIT